MQKNKVRKGHAQEKNLSPKNILPLIAAAFIFLIPDQSFAGKYMVFPEIGTTNVRFGQDFSLTGEVENDSSLATAFNFGYRFSSNLVTVINFGYTGNFNFFGAFDRYEISEINGAVGYTFEVSDKFRLVPMAGISSWTLNTKEGVFLNPGQEESQDFDGHDSFWKLNGELVIRDNWLFNMSYTKYNYEFGDTRSFRIGLIYEF